MADPNTLLNNAKSVNMVGTRAPEKRGVMKLFNKVAKIAREHEMAVLIGSAVLIGGAGGIYTGHSITKTSTDFESQTVAVLKNIEHVPAKNEWVCEGKTAAFFDDEMFHGAGTYCHYKRQNDTYKVTYELPALKKDTTIEVSAQEYQELKKELAEGNVSVTVALNQEGAVKDVTVTSPKLSAGGLATKAQNSRSPQDITGSPSTPSF